MAVKGIYHVGISTSDLDRSIKFYTEVLGFECTHIFDWDEGVGMGMAAGKLYKQAMIQTPNLEMELFGFKTLTDKSCSSVPADSVAKVHIALAVEDIDSIKQRLDAAGIKFYDNVNEFRAPGYHTKWVYCEDPDGVTLELIDRFDDYEE